MSSIPISLSVLIPLYNSEEYIERCLDSLLEQNVPMESYEIIVMDDGSTDSSRAKVSEYQRKHNNVHLHTVTNAGAYSTRNKLLKLARGEYLYCVDSDDYLAHDTLGPILAFAQKHRLDIAGFKSLITDSTEAIDFEAESNFLEPHMISDGCEFLKDNEDMQYEVWWYLIRRDFLEKHNISFNKNEFNADVLFTLNSFLRAKKVGFFPVSVYRYFQSPDSLMRNKDNEHRFVMVENLLAMITDFNLFINSLETRSLRDKKQIIDNLYRRRDNFVVFLLVKIIESKMNSNTIKEYVDKLKDSNLYPVKRLKNSKDTYARKAFIKFILNQEHLLYPFAGIYKILNLVRS